MIARMSLHCLTVLIAAVAFAALGSCGYCASAERWNEACNISVLEKYRADGEASPLQQWQVAQMTWPSKEEIAASSVTPAQSVKDEAVGWIKRFMNPDFLPAGFEDHMVAMKQWGITFEKDLHGRRCDAFIVRYRSGSYVVHIQESPYEVAIAISDETSGNSSRSDHRKFVETIAAKALKPDLLADPIPPAYKKTETRAGRFISFLDWAVPVPTDGGQGDLGAMAVITLTDGQFVRLRLVKYPGDKRASYDAYEQRFSSPPRKPATPARTFALPPTREAIMAAKSREEGIHVPTEAELTQLSTEELVVLSGRLAAVDAIPVATYALSRPLTPDQDAQVRYCMGYKYGWLKDGVKMREKYQEILDMHPGYERNVEIAFHMGALHTYQILPGTTQDKSKAATYYEYVIAHCDPDKVYYEALESHLALANLYGEAGDYAKAKEHAEVVYRADIEKTEPLPFMKFETPEKRSSFVEQRKSFIRIVKAKGPTLLVAACERRDPEDTVTELEKLKVEYPSDPEVIRLANERMAEIARKRAAPSPGR